MALPWKYTPLRLLDWEALISFKHPGRTEVNGLYPTTMDGDEQLFCIEPRSKASEFAPVTECPAGL